MGITLHTSFAMVTFVRLAKPCGHESIRTISFAMVTFVRLAKPHGDELKSRKSFAMVTFFEVSKTTSFYISQLFKNENHYSKIRTPSSN